MRNHVSLCASIAAGVLLVSLPLRADYDSPTFKGVQPPAQVTVYRDMGPVLKGSTGFPSPVTLVQPMLYPVVGADADNDGLSDHAEAELADAFRPFLVFDSRENARRPNEPVTVFQVRPEGCVGPRSKCGGTPLKLHINYLNLWRDDGGYVNSFFCGDAHKGDNQSVSLTVQSEDDGRTFKIVTVENWGYIWPIKSGAVHFWAGTHPWIYFSAGKHHQFFDSFIDGKASPYSDWACREGMDGKGDFLLSDLGWPGQGFNVKWNNVGEPEAHDPLYFVNDLGTYGFPGESAWATHPFCGGQACKKDNPTSHNGDVWLKTPFKVAP